MYGDTLARQIRLQKRQVVLTNADLTAAALTQTIALGNILPSNAVLVGYNLLLTDAFDSPGAGSLDVQIGDDTTDDDSILAAFDAYTGSAFEGLRSVGTVGIAYMGIPSGLTLEILLTATVDNLSTFTNGNLTIQVWFTAEFFAE